MHAAGAAAGAVQLAAARTRIGSGCAWQGAASRRAPSAHPLNASTHPPALSYPTRYAHPLDLLPLVDLNLGKVVNIECYDRPAT